MADKMSRRRLLTKFLPGMALGTVAPLEQYPYGELPPPGADTPLNLTIRITTQETKTAVILAIIAEQGKVIRWLSSQLLQPGRYGPERPKAT